LRVHGEQPGELLGTTYIREAGHCCLRVSWICCAHLSLLHRLIPAIVSTTPTPADSKVRDSRAAGTESDQSFSEQPVKKPRTPTLSHEMTCGAGTLLWMSPEIVRSLASRLTGEETTAYSQAIDTYSFAIIMWEALELKSPWSSKPEYLQWTWTIMDAVEKGERPLVSRTGPPGYDRLMKDCWAQDPQDRPHINDVQARLEVIQYKSIKSDLLANLVPANRMSYMKEGGRPRSNADTGLFDGLADSSNTLIQMKESNISAVAMKRQNPLMFGDADPSPKVQGLRLLDKIGD